MESGDIVSGDAELGSVLNGHCSKCEFTIAHVITQHLFRPYKREDRVVRELLACYIMAMLNAA